MNSGRGLYKVNHNAAPNPRPNSTPLRETGLGNLSGYPGLSLQKGGTFLPFFHIRGVSPGAPGWLADLQSGKGGGVGGLFTVF